VKKIKTKGKDEDTSIHGTEFEYIWSDMERSVKIYGACGVVLACVDGSVVVVSSIWCSACLCSLCILYA
jgi:hypothetical protein